LAKLPILVLLRFPDGVQTHCSAPQHAAVELVEIVELVEVVISFSTDADATSVSTTFFPEVFTRQI